MRKVLRRRGLLAVALGLALCGVPNTTLAQQTVDFDDFESLGPSMVPFSIDYFQAGLMPGEFDGWSLMDVSSWIGHADNQDGRDRCYFGSDPANRNVALVADPDEADDSGNSDMGSPADPRFNAYARVTVDTTGLDLSTLELSFDFDFVCEDTQTGIVQISFDGGNSYETILEIDSAVVGANDAYSTNPDVVGDDGINQGILVDATYVAGTDFTAPASANSVIVQFGCIRASNDWWFAVDNVALSTTADGEFYFEDFERDPTLADLPFSSANSSDDSDGTDWSKNVPAEWELDNSQNTYPTEQPDFDPSDGTDWTQDLSTVGWEIINDGPADLPNKKMYYESAEGAYNGGAVLDAFSWSYQTDDSAPTQADIDNINTGFGQRRSMFRGSFFGQRNSVLVFDPDQSRDNIVDGSATDPPEGENVFNSFAQKTYDVALFDNDSVSITLEWEIRVESPQNQVMQVSFNGGDTWTTIFEFDATNLADAGLQAAYLPFLDFDDDSNVQIDNGDIIRTESTGAQTIILSDFFPSGNVPDSNTMRFRIGCLNAGNNWWFAVDNILVEANPQSFVFGDTNGDGVVNNGDLGGAIIALSGGAYDETMDFNEDGVINNGDIPGFINAVLGR